MQGGPRLNALEKIVPAYGWIRGYKRSDLRHDFFAGLTIAVIVVPQSMAYALLAGLPPEIGLYASSVPLLVYALVGSSRHLATGPVALVSLLTFTGVSGLAEPGSSEYVGLVLLLALMAGIMQLAMGLLRMGFVINFLPRPVISGFTSAAAITIALSQLQHLLGIELPSEGSALTLLIEAWRNIQGTSPITLAIGVGSIVALLFFAKLLPRIPGPLLIVAGTTPLVYFLGLNERGVSVVENVPQGLPSFSLPPLDLGMIGALASTALIVALIGFMESISMAKLIATTERYKIDSNRELEGIGLANIGAAFFSAYPIAGSFSRTAVNHQSGARTQLSSVIVALLVIATLLFLTPLFYYLPNAVLAAIVMVAVYGLINVRDARHFFKIQWADGLTLLLTFALTLLVGVEEGIIAGGAFALLAFIRRTAYPNITELGYVEEEDTFLGVRSYPESETFPETLIIRFDAALYYANVSFLEEWLIKEVVDRPQLEWIVIDCRGVNSIDVTAIEGLEDLVSGYRSRGIDIMFTNMKRQVRERLETAGWEEKFGDTMNYPTVRDALRAVGLLADHEAPRPEPSQ